MHWHKIDVLSVSVRCVVKSLPGSLQPDGIVCEVKVVEDEVWLAAVQDYDAFQHTRQQLSTTWGKFKHQIYNIMYRNSI